MYWYAEIRNFVFRILRQQDSSHMVCCCAEIRFCMSLFIRTSFLSVYGLFPDRNKVVCNLRCTKIIRTERFCCVGALKNKSCTMLIHSQRSIIHFLSSFRNREFLSFAGLPKKTRVLYGNYQRKDRLVLSSTYLYSAIVRKDHSNRLVEGDSIRYFFEKTLFIVSFHGSTDLFVECFCTQKQD